jgi:hypothetical protein
LRDGRSVEQPGITDACVHWPETNGLQSSLRNVDATVKVGESDLLHRAVFGTQITIGPERPKDRDAEIRLAIRAWIAAKSC